MIDINAIKARLREAYCGSGDYEAAISDACNDVAAICDEVERLRAEVDLLRTGREAARSYADRVEAEVVALRGADERERAAVVAWLRREATDGFVTLRIHEACAAEKLADAIERGAHRREEEP
jgi:hypothetical protein